MKKFTNKYYYYSYWCKDYKDMNDNMSSEEAKIRFNDKKQIGNSFYILVGDEKKPKYIISYVSKYMITISALNKNLDPFLKLDYEIMENLDKDKLFFVRYLERKYDKNNNQIMAKTTGFATLNHNNGNHIHTILDNPIYEKLDNITNIEETGKIDVPVVEEALWRDYPKFGEWDFMVEDIEAMIENLNEMGDV